MTKRRRSTRTSSASAKKNGWQNKYTAWIIKYKKISIPVLVLFIAAISYVVIFFTILNKPTEQAPTKRNTKETVVEEKEVIKYFSALTGNEVPSESDLAKPVNAVMIENTPAARPQSGLQESEVVYELATEAGITRFLAIYQQSQPELIGPVRSLRPAFIDYLAPYDASVLHVGGSQEALNEIRNGRYRDLDQFFNGNSYWRSTDRYAPHNVYINSENISSLNQSKGYVHSTPKPIPRSEGGMQAHENPALQPNFDVPSYDPTYSSHWSYDETNNNYIRSQAGQPHLDREKGQITADVVIVLTQDWWRTSDNRTNFATTGEGDGVIYHKGNKYQIRWHKQDKHSQYTFTHGEKEIILPKGKTWFAAIPGQRVNY